jgi:hypothetical protein
MSNMIGHTSMAFGSAGVKTMDTKRAYMWRSLAIAEAKALKQPQQSWGYKGHRSVRRMEVAPHFNTEYSMAELEKPPEREI